MDFCVQFMGVVTNYMWKHRERETHDGAESQDIQKEGGW